eukprot:CAMPEP_0116569352 /NCGR_PEP_ID=MMETSP0397-20121206/16257_1 /TAXON_ID=216820 /ORGANISM="Cyclophora tenuis, Strain ECT3854" /LENGTH=74 /DNA_ID=CAMNT_0004096929 /DNA_START=209 /DNA_END=430 /DNA_ORIENTATION=+
MNGYTAYQLATPSTKCKLGTCHETQAFQTTCTWTAATTRRIRTTQQRRRRRPTTARRSPEAKPMSYNYQEEMSA